MTDPTLETTAVKPRSLEPISLRITPTTNHLLLRIHDHDTTSGIGEASMSGSDSQTAAAAERLFNDHLRDRSVDDPHNLTAELHRAVGPHPPMTTATAVSALDQALWDLFAKRAGRPIHALLGQQRRTEIPLYANINRGLTHDRRPAAFAEQARAAVAAGFAMIKCAPFDETLPDQRPPRIDPGLMRVAAIREAVGSDVSLMVDCHGRLDPTAARVVAEELEPLDVRWLEEPLTSHPDMHTLARVSTTDASNPDSLGAVVLNTEATAALSARTSIPLAGGEFFFGRSQFERLIARAGLRYLMPDVKHCGGIGALRDIARAAYQHGISVSPHNPTGAVATLATAHACAVLPQVDSLEYQWGEDASRIATVTPPETVEGGRLVIPAGPGLGVALNEDLIEDCRVPIGDD